MFATTMHELMVEEIRDLYHAERQLVKALAGMARRATTLGLRKALVDHLEQTESHVSRIREVFALLGIAPSTKPCLAMVGLLEEGHEHVAAHGSSSLVDAALITAAQKADHYEIAAYGSAIAHARVIGEEEIASILEETLAEEKASDRTLTELAMSGINNRAGTTH